MRSLPMLVMLLMLAVSLFGCRETHAPPPAVETNASALHFEGIVRVAPDPPPGPGKKFRGEWIERADGNRWVIDYEEESPFRAMRDLRVHVSGSTWVPEGQALVATHFRVESMEIVGKNEQAPLVRIGPRRTIHGQFVEMTYPPGTKLEGETERLFQDDAGRRYHLARHPEKMPALEVAVTIDAHEVEPSPFIARPGGPYLWIRKLED